MKTKDIGLFRGFGVCHKGEVVTHLQFANDTILFCLAIKEAVVALKRILCRFYLSPGLKVNLAMSLVGVGCSEDVTQSLANNFHC